MRLLDLSTPEDFEAHNYNGSQPVLYNAPWFILETGTIKTAGLAPAFAKGPMIGPLGTPLSASEVYSLKSYEAQGWYLRFNALFNAPQTGNAYDQIAIFAVDPASMQMGWKGNESGLVYNLDKMEMHLYEQHPGPPFEFNAVKAIPPVNWAVAHEFAITYQPSFMMPGRAVVTLSVDDDVLAALPTPYRTGPWKVIATCHLTSDAPIARPISLNFDDMRVNGR